MGQLAIVTIGASQTQKMREPRLDGNGMKNPEVFRLEEIPFIYVPQRNASRV